MYELTDEPEPFKPSLGFYAFLVAVFLPVIAAVFIYLGAWAVSAEVNAAEAASLPSERQTVSNSLNDEEAKVAGWKKTLVGVCPVH
ncbi:MAG TPA: hypothetical protein VJB57_03090 [Dehalococcoidia bacterium]|nr:hypothetical protein [Dehalococcoidia bacterium]